MKGPKKIGIAITPLVVVALATIGCGFFAGCMIRGEDYIWAAVIAAAVVLGTGTMILASEKPVVHRIRSKIANAEHVIVNDYRLIYASRKHKAGARSIRTTNRVSDVIVKVTNGDHYPHIVAVDVDINDEPIHRVIRDVAIAPSATTYVAVPLSKKMPLGDIELLSIRLKQTS